MKTCPNCGRNKVQIFDSNNDFCQDCGKWFPAVKDQTIAKPKVVCLCGSSRFYKEYQQAEYDETMKGNIYLSIGFYPHSSEQAHGESVRCTPEQKIALDELHKRKIDLADEVYVLDVGGYIGDSTSSEIKYARKMGKPVRFMSRGD